MPRLGHGFDDVINVVDGVGNPGIFGFGGVTKIDIALLVHHDIFQQGVAPDGIVNVGLMLLAQVDGLGVAAAFEIEYAVVIPAVFVIPDKLPFGVG